MTVTMFEAKTRLSQLVKQAQAGEEVIITSGREKKPVAKLLPVEERKGVRLGLWYDPDFKVSPDFWDPLSEEELAAWEGE